MFFPKTLVRNKTNRGLGRDAHRERITARKSLTVRTLMMIIGGHNTVTPAEISKLVRSSPDQTQRDTYHP